MLCLEECLILFPTIWNMDYWISTESFHLPFPKDQRCYWCRISALMRGETFSLKSYVRSLLIGGRGRQWRAKVRNHQNLSGYISSKISLCDKHWSHSIGLRHFLIIFSFVTFLYEFIFSVQLNMNRFHITMVSVAFTERLEVAEKSNSLHQKFKAAKLPFARRANCRIVHAKGGSREVTSSGRRNRTNLEVCLTEQQALKFSHI